MGVELARVICGMSCDDVVVRVRDREETVRVASGGVDVVDGDAAPFLLCVVDVDVDVVVAVDVAVAVAVFS